ncbi:neutral/alkaline non-lysosomal ceramidase N-terminal domain-containing protein [Paenibacillus sp. MBLB4367]|uniref:neutral/alkaline non-lysosomal ceramidase N-terminal domain-containing protein n=1 Tax=Paenibacillus sp. MBLB4367 TaxID=3384767 RepID=UPI003907FE81
MMKFGIAKEEITPLEPVFMHGFGSRTHKSEGLLEPLYMTATMMQADRTFLIVTIDALGSDRSFIVGIKDELKRAFGLSHEEVMINFSHTHHSVFLTGPDPTLRRGGYSIGQSRWADDESELDYAEDMAYYIRLRDTLQRMVGSCYDNLTEGELSMARGTSEFACSRRRPDGAGGVMWMPYYEGEIDKDLFVLKLSDSTGAVRGIVYCYGCHTTAMSSDNYKFGNDFAGAASAMLEQRYPGAVAIFLQGCAGELKPRPGAVGDEFVSCDEARLRQVGDMLAQDVIAVMEYGSFRTVSCQFRAELCDPLLYTEQTSASFYRTIADDPQQDDFHRASARRTIKAFENGTIKDRIPFYISVWQLDEETSLIAMEGEVSTEYGLMLKRLFGNGSMIVLGYTNGVFSYVPTRKMIGEGGYEAACNYYFGLRGPFVPEIEDIIVGQVASAIGRLSACNRQ